MKIKRFPLLLLLFLLVFPSCSNPDRPLTVGELAEMAGVLYNSEVFPDPGIPASRGDAAMLFMQCIPEDGLPLINSVFGITDVHSSRTAPVADSRHILALCRAGVMTVDENGLFRPGAPVTRREAAQILDRLRDPGKRLRYEILPANGVTARLSDYHFTTDDGKTLSLGYHTSAEWEAFLGDAVPMSETVHEHHSIDGFFRGDPLSSSYRSETYQPAEEGKSITAVYEDFTVSYLTADRDPLGVFVWVLSGTAPGTADMRGIHAGCTRDEVEAQYSDHPIRYTDETDAVGSFAEYAYYHTEFKDPSGEPVYISYRADPGTGTVLEISLNCSISG